MINKKQKTLSVADFIEEVNSSLLSFCRRIQGEVTSINKTYPKAIYFTIKDNEKDALLNCVIWRSAYVQNSIDLKEGDEVVITGTPEIYAPYGKFSLKTQTIEYAGEGALKKSYEELKKKLIKEGLLDIARKRSLPKFPKKIGLITSTSGVVIQDFSANLGRYGFKIKLINSRVEGKDAIHDLLSSIKTLSKEDIEVLVIIRGGGSWESLQPFNTESVIRAISNFKCPVLTGIGHDVDITLSQLVADVGVSTPTAVSEKLNEGWDNLINHLNRIQIKILTKFRTSLSKKEKQIINNSNSVKTHFYNLEKILINANFGFKNINNLLKSAILFKRNKLKEIPSKISKIMTDNLFNTKQSISKNNTLILANQKNWIKQTNEKLSNLEKIIKKSDPSHNLKLGYSIAYINNKIIRSIFDIKNKDEINIQVSDGMFTSNIKNVK